MGHNWIQLVYPPPRLGAAPEGGVHVPAAVAASCVPEVELRVRRHDGQLPQVRQHPGVAVQAAFENQTLKPVSHLVGSRVETGRFQAQGKLNSTTCTVPPCCGTPSSSPRSKRYKLTHLKGNFETGFSLYRLKGLKPGAFKLFVNWIQQLQTRRFRALWVQLDSACTAPSHLDDDRQLGAVPLLGVGRLLHLVHVGLVALDVDVQHVLRAELLLGLRARDADGQARGVAAQVALLKSKGLKKPGYHRVSSFQGVKRETRRTRAFQFPRGDTWNQALSQALWNTTAAFSLCAAPPYRGLLAPDERHLGAQPELPARLPHPGV
jgi:hypothetical protein